MPETTTPPVCSRSAETVDPAVVGFDAAPTNELMPVLTELSGSKAWARAVLEGRPYCSRDALHAAARQVLDKQGDAEVLAAVDAHPPIGAGSGGGAGTGAPREVGQASAREQSAAATADAELARRLAEGQSRHAEHFGHAFLVCATGLTAQDIVAELDRRIDLTAAEELATTREHLAAINALRLDRLLDTGAL
ncbi:2-oxo-4-hydroxy-4-carboxy-5-ureidoimidazoline decarboxylase [Dietzia sp. B32]|uniref:2-oxo-4-hydroxy-4-carboxy-5-ureidoimidazoline decarboxylase n=1 Tax=Dietzia sp. B32 TaxID=2915130 RepID=UPI0021AE0A72|nr:2-oxo-4-hydroxy-4-carboxy-5-ureidoimidazoline decarboxylase [Dietzia sp. B32]UVE96482.1 2-oxo-4-hydroxy-4-carboxy-5-ureidoimidazoline decarboxylase [Dietzia sp. B32]